MRTCLALFLSSVISSCFAAPSLEGYWEGTLSITGISLRVGLNVKKVDGGYKATVDSPDQGARDIPVDSIALNGDEVKFEIASLKATYVGKLKADGSEIVGKFSQATTVLDLNLKHLDKRPEVKGRPQDPKKPYPYKEEEVTYENKVGGIKLAGTLTTPPGPGPFPVAILITGSGPQNRNEELLNHRPFLVLADALTRKGIAVLRVDDRGVGGSTGVLMNSTGDDLATDVVAGIEYLKTRKEINPKKIGVIGHSEGGIIGPLVAANHPKDVAFVVMMAGTGVTGEQILYEQSKLISKAAGASDDSVAKNRAIQERLFNIMRTEKDPAAFQKKMDELTKDTIALMTPEQLKEAGGEEQVRRQLRTMATPWFTSFLFYDPAPTLARVQCPVLALNGSKDLQVPPAQNLPPIEKALKAGGNKDFTIKEFPNLNHLFQTSTTGSPGEYALIEETISPVVLDTICDWVVKKTK